MNIKLPVIKKKISSYILGEEGKISKQSLLSLGTFFGTAAIAAALAACNVDALSTSHHNYLGIYYGSYRVTASHSHHGSY